MWDVLKLVVAPFNIWLESRKEKAAAKSKRDLALINNQHRLLSDKQTNNHEWEMAALADKDKALRFISYSIFALPILVTVGWPEQGAQIFKNLEAVPKWWVQTFVAINGGVWGIVELKNAAPALIAAIKGAIRG